jgi:predicted SnoaL-like aldol condensation-catalyzing enzyme
VFKLLRLLLTPLPELVKDIRIIRELYEADLAERHIHRQTEKPKTSDTSVSYSGFDSESRSAFGKWEAQLEEDMQREEEEDE